MIEKVRLTLIRWNVAPLCVVAVLCKGFLMTLSMMQEVAKCSAAITPIDAAFVAGLFTFAGVIAGLLYKAYESTQKDRGHVS